MKLQGMTLLLVEDDVWIQMDLKQTLQRQGATVIAASDLETGLAACAQPVDAAVLDIRLGEADVLPIAQRLHAQQTPLVFHSALIERRDVAESFPDAAMLPKPVSESVLIDTVAKVVKGQ